MRNTYILQFALYDNVMVTRKCFAVLYLISDVTLLRTADARDNYIHELYNFNVCIIYFEIGKENNVEYFISFSLFYVTVAGRSYSRLSIN